MATPLLAALLLGCSGTPAERARAACEAGDARVCAELGGWLQNGEQGLITNRKQAEKYYAMACEGGVADGCRGLAETTRTTSVFVTALETGCTLEDPKACTQLGARLFRVEPRDPERGAQLLDSACAGGHEQACSEAIHRMLDAPEAQWATLGVQRGAEACLGGRTALCNDTAWAWAVHPAVDRTGVDGVEVARRAAAAEPNTPGVLDTLAAALARAGDFDRAIAMQEEALSLLGSGGGRGVFLARLEGYRARLPWNQLPKGEGYSAAEPDQ